MQTFLLSLLCFGIIAGKNATTDGYVYLGHNEDQSGEQMLNIYNVPATPDRLAYLWFEFPGAKAGHRIGHVPFPRGQGHRQPGL